jgi:putative membrane protein
MKGGLPGLSLAESGSNHLRSGLLLWYGLLWTWLVIAPVNRRDWLLENLLAFALVVLLVLTYRRFQFSDVSYGLIACFMTLHAVGAHYTYAEVPFGFWLKDLFSLSRNPFDRIVHFAYGALLAYPVREALMRLVGVRGLWSYYLPAGLILAQSGLFEIIESVVAAFVSPELGSAYLGTQGDEWDAQKDMASAFGAAALAMIITLTTSRGFKKTAHRVDRVVE